MTGLALRRMERDLAGSDPGLNELFLIFARQAGPGSMPPAEQLKTWRVRLREIARSVAAFMALTCVLFLIGSRRGLPWVIPR
jgi:hypothetical protein